MKNSKARIRILPIHFVQGSYHRKNVSSGFKNYTLNTIVPINIITMKLVNDRHPCLEPMVPIPNHEHLIGKYLQVLICKKFLLKFFIHLLPHRRPLGNHIGGHVIGVAMVVLQCHIKETTPLHIAISHKMSCKLRYNTFKKRSHNRKRHHAAKRDKETTLLFWLPF